MKFPRTCKIKRTLSIENIHACLLFVRSFLEWKTRNRKTKKASLFPSNLPESNLLDIEQKKHFSTPWQAVRLSSPTLNIQSDQKGNEEWNAFTRAMEAIEQRSFQTDLDDDDDEESTGRRRFSCTRRKKHSLLRIEFLDEQTLPPLSFDKRLLAHHSNRRHQTFGQRNLPSPANAQSPIDDEALLRLSYKTPVTPTGNFSFDQTRIEMTSLSLSRSNDRYLWEELSLSGHDRGLATAGIVGFGSYRHHGSIVFLQWYPSLFYGHGSQSGKFNATCHWSDTTNDARPLPRTE